MKYMKQMEQKDLEHTIIKVNLELDMNNYIAYQKIAVIEDDVERASNNIKKKYSLTPYQFNEFLQYYKWKQ